MHAGLEMTLKLLIDALEKSSIKPINPLGQLFDPTLHQAISVQENPEAQANTVLEVLQKGYQLHDRLIRPALVVVAK
jgi:molecular chaperone GrpE